MKVIIHSEMEQNTDEWYKIRSGKMTGTGATFATSKGRNDKGIAVTFQKYIWKKAGEIVTDAVNFDEYGSASMQRGNALERPARQAYEEYSYNVVNQVGFVQLGNYLGVSPDGLVGLDGGLEIKCLEHAGHMQVVDTGKADKEKDFIAQVQFSLFVTKRKWWDRVYFHPEFKEKSLIVNRAFPDPDMQELFEEKTKYFISEMERLTSLCNTSKPNLTIQLENSLKIA